MLVAMLCGFWPHATADAAQALLADHSAGHLVHYETSRPGVLARRGGGEIPAEGDPAAALLADLISATSRDDSSDRLVILPESVEPDRSAPPGRPTPAPARCR